MQLWLHRECEAFATLKITECGGHSSRETPEPIPNSEDKLTHVLHCTQVREPSGNADRCHIHLTFFSTNFINAEFSILIYLKII